MADKTLKALRAELFRGPPLSDATGASLECVAPECARTMREDQIWERRKHCEARLCETLEQKAARSEQVKEKRAEQAREALERVKQKYMEKVRREEETQAARDAQLRARVAQSEEFEKALQARVKAPANVESDSGAQKSLLRELQEMQDVAKQDAVVERITKSDQKLKQFKTQQKERQAEHFRQVQTRREGVKARLDELEEEEFQKRQEKLDRLQAKLQRTDETRTEFFELKKATAGEKTKRVNENLVKYSQSFEIIRSEKLQRMAQRGNKSFVARHEDNGDQATSPKGSKEYRERAAEILSGKPAPQAERHPDE